LPVFYRLIPENVALLAVYARISRIHPQAYPQPLAAPENIFEEEQ
jgi:hypothetical protein